jgi:methylthioribose-1-phosphate isomerase
MKEIKSKVEPIVWKGKSLYALDQRVLPFEKKYIELTSYKDVINAIKDMVVRGAPLIGITAGYGLVLAANEYKAEAYHGISLQRKLIKAGEEIKKSRPTAVNLAWAIDLILNDIQILDNADEIITAVEKRAFWIHEDDKNRCQMIGEYGSSLIKDGNGILTICNTGALATGGIGTAFGVIHTAHTKNQEIKIFASETRPRQQGAKLSTYEFYENGIDCTLIPDTACGFFMQRGDIDIVIVGADRIAKNGDTANKIGTYQLAVLAKENNIPFYVAAPLSTFDMSINSGGEIPIEERSETEVKIINDKLICVEGIKVKNPAFDVTPHRYITGIITEKGIISGDLSGSISSTFNEATIA